MKNSLLVVAMFMIFSQIGLSQSQVTFYMDEEGYVVKRQVEQKEVEQKEVEQKKVSLCFEVGVPTLSNKQISQLLKDRKIERSRHNLKGRYELGILFYVPRVEVDSCFLSEGNVSYKGFEVKEQSKKISLWYLFSLMGLVCMVCCMACFQKAGKDVFVIVVFVSAAFAAIAGFAAFGFLAFGFLAVPAVAAFWLAVVAVSNKKKYANIFAWLYCVSMIVGCVLIYLLW